MAQNKKTEFPEKIQRIASFTKLLSHPARLAILEVLAQKQTCVCGEIVEILPLAQSTVSQHLKELKDGGLVKGEVEGTSSCYCIHWENLNLAYREFSDQMQMIENFKNQKGGSCCE
ncbi:ArsR/SmtB family transcription factor [Leptospira kanakyensis]|uniref:ArsR family transcriptional regulator n=1 Tax=Leptospira kanakyensis TaxID=2484968 RepID=A0A6N4Q1P2_9LEPT|nr:metalloregulator ArsR/SmtB family transcription factor [Leptospira kanakyensis]MCW7468540.1 metalloregulator ArsR/SmtB family transcription factor [Leptospira kanakyensis]MCW7479532.1 metalloregulator ArsR/SmtB family transcription factor [Leptospira kanakyensis]TGK51598.1 ArsR family transcriptional regulator [Leptospira kanakyensis]TGK58701.1 ArsR family transcriptional regulator [Leptospira kanakyensis]TGK70904.1 ArsR family transcriptional regulator [Leptospira kanakyensis]